MTTDMIDLSEAVGRAVQRVRTKSVDYSFNELLDMFKTGELIIHPAYQRLFRWPIEKRSQFIESILLELPIPPIYVVEEEGGRYELIDGLQRFSSYLHFRGILPLRSEDEAQMLQLDGCDVVRELNGKTYDDLPTALQIRLKRMSVPVEVLRKESDQRLRYHMFKRLNTGGERLSPQEIRNATIRLLGTRFNDFLQEMARTDDFSDCMSLMTEEAKDRMGKEECVLRFFAFKNAFEDYEKLITPFLDEFMEKMSDPSTGNEFNYVYERQVFLRTFSIFRRALGEETFSNLTRSGTASNQFSMAHFDMLSQGIQPHVNKLDALPDTSFKLFGEAIRRLKLDTEYRKQTSGGGKNYASAYRRGFSLVQKAITKWLRSQ